MMQIYTNYFYIKAVSPGIQGVYDFKIEITAGAYTIPELITNINASIADASTLLTCSPANKRY